MKKRNIKPAVGRCGDCANAVPVTEFHTLALSGAPTLASCPFVTNRRVLLTEGCPVGRFRRAQGANV